MSLKLTHSTAEEQAGFAIGTYHIADNPQMYEIQRSNNFIFTCPDLDGITGFDGNTFANANSILEISVSSAFVPHFTQNAIEVKRGNSTVKFAGVPTFKTGTLECVDYIGANTLEALMAWQSKSYNVKTEKVGLVSDYKRDCWLIEYTPDYQEVRKWRLHGCWISDIQEQPFNSEANDKRNISVTIEYDRAELDTSTTVQGAS